MGGHGSMDAPSGRSQKAVRAHLPANGEGTIDGSPTAARHWTRRAQRGFTVVELLVVIAILAVMAGGGIYLLGMITHSHLKDEATRMATAMRYTSDQAGLNNRQYRMIIDLDSQEYYTEVTEEEVVLEDALDDIDDRYDEGLLPEEVREMEEQRRSQRGSMFREEEDDPFGISQRTGYQRAEESQVEPRELDNNIIIERVRVETRSSPVTEGRVAIHYFPSGLQQQAKVVFRDPSSEMRYTLITEPLTGRVHVYSGERELPEDFGEEEYRG